LESFGFLQALASLAETDGMLERDPYKTQYEFSLINFLASSYLQKLGASIRVTDADKRAFYEANLRQYQEVQVSAIYINYTPIPEVAERQGVPVILESDAQAKAEALHAQLVAGADFAELAREHSDDTASAGNGGDLGFFRPEDPLSDVIKATVFRMGVGQTSAPVKDAGRFYIFRVMDSRARPLEDVEAAIDKTITSGKLNARLAEIRSDIKIQSSDSEWLQAKPSQ
jgi:parvulin-like peptidyl-prolyl isomerase